VEKIPTVREKVRVGKREVEDTRDIPDETRREELRVEKEGDVRELDDSEVEKPRRKKTA
jgi:stress response protein YsnF